MISAYYNLYIESIDEPINDILRNDEYFIKLNFAMHKSMETHIVNFETEMANRENVLNKKIGQLNDQVAFIRSHPIHNIFRYISKIIKREPIS